MATVVALHAHPDDECILTGGTLARAAAEGHKVVLVVATGGEHGMVPGDLAEGESLADRRRAETRRSADILGIDVVEFLGFEDSGMNGWSQNDNPAALRNADLEVAVERLAGIARREGADVVLSYDWHGGYGHPDHVMVHRIGRAAAAGPLAGAVLLEGTMNRDRMRAMVAAAREAGMTDGDDGTFDPDAPADDGNPMGTPEAEIALEVDVLAHVGAKRSAIACHASQIDDSAVFTAMSEEMFAAMFGTEWFIDPRRGGPPHAGWIV